MTAAPETTCSLDPRVAAVPNSVHAQHLVSHTFRMSAHNRATAPGVVGVSE
jgi:hypothetical protein